MVSAETPRVDPLHFDLQRLGQAAGQTKKELLDSIDESFERVLEENVDPKDSAKNQTLREVVEDRTRQAGDIITATPVPGSPGVPLPPLTDWQPPTHVLQPQHHTAAPQPLPVVVPDPAYQPPPPLKHEVETHVVPRRRRPPKRTDAAVDNDLVEALKAHGLKHPVVNDEDKRLYDEAPFEAGWIRVGTDDSYSVTWRSPQDMAGTWQRCFLSASATMIETAALGKLQTIDIRDTQVTVTRTFEPPPTFSESVLP